MGAVRGAGALQGRRPLSANRGRARDGAWRVVERRASPAELHATTVETEHRRTVALCHPTTAAVVLGSSQPASDFDEQALAERGLDLVRRRSGGGAVLVEPDGQLWVDVFLPADDALYDADVVRSSAFLGAAYDRALGELIGPAAAVAVHDGRLSATAWSPVLCFAGLGPGEVTVDGRKVVGLSQRRDRHGAWLHTLVALDGRGAQLADVLARSPGERAGARAVLEATGLRSAEPTEAVAPRLASFLLAALED